MGLSIQKFQKVTNVSIKSLLGIEATQLRKTTFSNYKLFEATYVAQIQVVDELSNNILEKDVVDELSNNILEKEDALGNTVHLYGTAEKGLS